MKMLNDFKREQVVLDRKIKFKHSKVTFEGIPFIMPSDNMFATFEVAEALPNVLTFISDDYEIEELYNFWFSNRPTSIYKMSNGQLTKFMNLMGKLPKGYLQHVFLDISNLNDMLETVKEIRKKFKNVTIWASVLNTDDEKYFDFFPDTIALDHLTYNGCDVIFAKNRNIIKLRECYSVGNGFEYPNDFYVIPINEGFSEFRGETNNNLQRVYKDKSLPLSEKTLQEFYNETVEKNKNYFFDIGCRNIQLHDYAE